MNTRLRLLVVLVCFVSTVAYSDSQGYIVPNGITYSSAGSMAVIDVLQNPANGDFVSFILKPEFKTVGDLYDTIFSFRPVPGQSVRTFLASPNDPISLQSIQAGSYSELSMGSYYGFDLDVPFYVGVYTGYTNGAPAGLYSNPVFGWAEFENHQGVIQLLDSALVMEGGGIYVGTQTIISVPEPGELSLFVVGVFILGWGLTRLLPAGERTKRSDWSIEWFSTVKTERMSCDPDWLDKAIRIVEKQIQEMNKKQKVRLDP